MADLTTTNSNVVIAVASSESVGIQLTGTFSAVASFLGSIDNSNYAALALLPIGVTNSISVTTASTTGVWIGTVKGLRTVKVNLGTYTSGTTTVTFTSVK